jgi:adenosylmethionine-8-amino-7-oxononanoate aminotransferase
MAGTTPPSRATPADDAEYLDDIQRLDRRHVWHPYAAVPNPLPCYPVREAHGCTLHLMDGRTIIDGMSSWWACIHGYNHPALNRAAVDQIGKMSHVMFGGLTHEPAVRLARALSDLPFNDAGRDPEDKLDKVFFCDSGSVAVEVAMKMALQYHHGTEARDGGGPSQSKSKFLTVRGGYHGDTFEAMSVCDPVNGMHHLFRSVLPQQIFCRRPTVRFGEEWDETDMDEIRGVMEDRHGEIAAVILEPVVQGAGGMRFYSPSYLHSLRRLCDEFDVLLIFDEIATGFGRTGKLFAMEHAPGVLPDILCIGKALSGGFLSFAAAVTSGRVARAFSREGGAGVLMHGPTFMGNPLACAVSLASLDLLKSYDLPAMIGAIEEQLVRELEPCRESPHVEDVRVLGAIGVVEMKEPIDMRVAQPQLVDSGVWLRPFGRLLYTMPPFIIQRHELRKITKAMVALATRRPR